jgi:hypothetical protein
MLIQKNVICVLIYGLLNGDTTGNVVTGLGFGFRSLWRQIFLSPPKQTESGAHPVSCPVDAGDKVRGT